MEKRNNILCLLFVIGAMVASLPAAELQKKASKKDQALLAKFSGSVERLVNSVSPAVVQISTAGFGPVEEGNSGVVTSQRGTPTFGVHDLLFAQSRCLY